MRREVRHIAQGAGLLLVAAVLLLWLWPHHALPAGTKADAILVVKSERTLLLLRNNEAISSYRVALGGNPTEHKAREGDGRSPEGRHTIAGRNRQSGFYRALRISYPDARDSEHARRLGVSAGGDIMVHGIERVRLARPAASTGGLDGWMHRGHGRGDA